MGLVEDDDMVEAFAADGSYEPLGMAILPRGSIAGLGGFRALNAVAVGMWMSAFTNERRNYDLIAVRFCVEISCQSRRTSI